MRIRQQECSNHDDFNHLSRSTFGQHIYIYILDTSTSIHVSLCVCKYIYIIIYIYMLWVKIRYPNNQMVNAKNQLTCVVPQVFNFDPYPYMSQYMSEYKRERMSGHISESMRRKLGIYIYVYIYMYIYIYTMNMHTRSYQNLCQTARILNVYV